MLKLHLGCGYAKRQGWVNIDSNPDCKPDLLRDLTTSLPYADNEIDFIYSEHCFEHLSLGEGIQFLIECRRVLKPLGVIRLSMPNLVGFVVDYLNKTLDKWTEAGWRPQTPAQMINEEFRSWGHQFIYDFDELNLSFKKAGFFCCQPRKWGESNYAPLVSLDMRPEHWGDLIVEGVK